MARILLALAAAVLAAATVACAQGRVGDAPSPLKQPEATALTPAAEPHHIVETTIANLVIRPRGRQIRKNVADYDILLLSDGRRLVPLLRTMRLLGLEPTADDSGYVFQATSAGPVRVDRRRETIRIAGTVRPLEFRTGISDVTSRTESWIPEDVLASVVDGEMTWDEARFEYQLTVSRELDWRPASQNDITSSFLFDDTFEFAEYERPRRNISLGPQLSFFRARFNSSALKSTAGNRTSYAVSPPKADIWGEGLGGAFVATVSSSQGWSHLEKAGVERATWTAWHDDVEFSAGDNRLGIADMVLPSVNVVGVRMNGLIGGGSGGRDRSRLGLRDTYSPVQSLRGTAPLGSEVTVIVNSHELDVGEVVPDPAAMPGDGVWTIEGLDLLTNRVNRIVVKVHRPDGRYDEHEYEVLGSDRLLPPHSAAFLVAAGTPRVSTAGETRGRFAGGRFHFGVSERLTMGLFAGWQENLLGPARPRASEHGGARLTWSFRGRSLLDLEVAGSRLGDEGVTGHGVDFGSQFYFGSWQLRPAFFRRSAGFQDGGLRPSSDRMGGRFEAIHRVGGHRFDVSALRAHDNLVRAERFTHTVTAAHAGWATRSLVPDCTVEFSGDALWWQSEEIAHRMQLGIMGNIPGGWRFRGWLDVPEQTDVRVRDAARWERLLSGVGVSDIGSPLGEGPQLRVERPLDKVWSLGFEGRISDTWRRTWVDITRRETAAGSLQLRAQAGYDAINKEPVAELHSAYYFDSLGRTRLIADIQRQPGSWTLHAGFQIDFLYGFAGARPYRVSNPSVDPDEAGVRGRVFLDANGNGVRDENEEGLGGVDLASDVGRRTQSLENGAFLMPMSSDRRRVTVGLRPSTLNALYTPTSPPREDVVLRPGLFTEVDFGVAVLGIISGRIIRGSGPDAKGIPGAQVEAIDAAGRSVAASITARDGSYVLDELRPGSYVVRVTPNTLPADLELNRQEVTVEVRSGIEPFEATADFGVRQRDEAPR